MQTQTAVRVECSFYLALYFSVLCATIVIRDICDRGMLVFDVGCLDLRGGPVGPWGRVRQFKP